MQTSNPGSELFYLVLFWLSIFTLLSNDRLEAPYSSKAHSIFIQERFNKLIYSINTIINWGIWQPVKNQLVSLFWTWSKIKWFFYCTSKSCIPGGRGFNPRRGRQHSFVEIDHEIYSTVIFSVPLIQEGQLSVSGERMCTILIDRLED